ncbi:MAG: hypothetical protein HC835_13445 [Oscillatoriales cyanobacterium RM2_1_1]|nr:hypothetical protein [Oscillatoriales cyanobacterium RM2_1_1]
MIGFLRGEDLGSKIAPTEGQHSNLGGADIFQSKGINPNNPGNWESYRTAPVVEARCFDSAEAQALTDLANEQKQILSSTRRGYRALKRLTQTDTKVNQSHEKYRQVEAGQELQRQSAKLQSAKYLHSLRPGYAKLGHSLEGSANRVDQAIAKLLGSL